MHRKIFLLLIAFLLTVTGLCAKPRPKPMSPYQYGRRWYISAQVGPQFLPAENVASYWSYGHGWKLVSPSAGVALGYNFTDAVDLRVAGNYGFHVSACKPYNGFFPYSFKAASLFTDLSLCYNALGENYLKASFKNYLGLGLAYTYGFTAVDHPYQVVESPNLVPALRFGGIWEFDSPGGFGWFIDLGIEFFGDWYNGQQPVGFPVDANLKLSFGLIYHFK